MIYNFIPKYSRKKEMHKFCAIIFIQFIFFSYRAILNLREICNNYAFLILNIQKARIYFTYCQFEEVPPPFPPIFTTFSVFTSFPPPGKSQHWIILKIIFYTNLPCYIPITNSSLQKTC